MGLQILHPLLHPLLLSSHFPTFQVYGFAAPVCSGWLCSCFGPLAEKLVPLQLENVLLWKEQGGQNQTAK